MCKLFLQIYCVILLDKFFFCLILICFLLLIQLGIVKMKGKIMRLIVYILLLGLIILTGAQFFKDYGNAETQHNFNQAQEIIQQQQDLLDLDASTLE